MSGHRTHSAAPVDAFRAHGTIDGPSIWRGDDFFMSDLEPRAAKRLAALLNEATDLAEVMATRGGIEHARTKLAYAVAKAMGRTIDFSEALASGAPLL